MWMSSMGFSMVDTVNDYLVSRVAYNLMTENKWTIFIKPTKT